MQTSLTGAAPLLTLSVASVVDSIIATLGSSALSVAVTQALALRIEFAASNLELSALLDDLQLFYCGGSRAMTNCEVAAARRRRLQTTTMDAVITRRLDSSSTIGALPSERIALSVHYNASWSVASAPMVSALSVSIVQSAAAALFDGENTTSNIDDIGVAVLLAVGGALGLGEDSLSVDSQVLMTSPPPPPSPLAPSQPLDPPLDAAGVGLAPAADVGLIVGLVAALAVVALVAAAAVFFAMRLRRKAMADGPSSAYRRRLAGRPGGDERLDGLLGNLTRDDEARGGGWEVVAPLASPEARAEQPALSAPQPQPAHAPSVEAAASPTTTLDGATPSPPTAPSPSAASPRPLPLSPFLTPTAARSGAPQTTGGTQSSVLASILDDAAARHASRNSPGARLDSPGSSAGSPPSSSVSHPAVSRFTSLYTGDQPMPQERIRAGVLMLDRVRAKQRLTRESASPPTPSGQGELSTSAVTLDMEEDGELTRESASSPTPSGQGVLSTNAVTLDIEENKSPEPRLHPPTSPTRLRQPTATTALPTAASGGPRGSIAARPPGPSSPLALDARAASGASLRQIASAAVLSRPAASSRGSSTLTHSASASALAPVLSRPAASPRGSSTLTQSASASALAPDTQAQRRLERLARARAAARSPRTATASEKRPSSGSGSPRADDRAGGDAGDAGDRV